LIDDRDNQITKIGSYVKNPNKKMRKK